MFQRQPAENKKNKGNRGFTLIEVLIAMAIFVIGILGLFTMQITATNSNAAARKRTEALYWASNRMEILMDTPYADIGNNQETQGIYNISWAVNEIDLNLDNNGDMDAKEIQIDVTWSGIGGQNGPTLDFIKVVP